MNEPVVFIVDDDVAVRDGLSLLCESVGLKVECCDSAESFLAAYRPGKPGCVVLDVRMGPMSGPELHSILAQRGDPLAIIYLTGHGDIPLSVRAIKAGAVDFLVKPVDGAELMERIQEALRKCQKLGTLADAKHAAAAQIDSLTSRERDVLRLAAQGLHNKQIARQLGISHRTVEIHRSRIVHKTGAQTMLDLARMATDGGLTA